MIIITIIIVIVKMIVLIMILLQTHVEPLNNVDNIKMTITIKTVIIIMMIVLIMILLQTHVEPLSSRVDCEGSSRQEVERGFELPPAIYQVDFLFFSLLIFVLFLLAMSAISLSKIQACFVFVTF